MTRPADLPCTAHFQHMPCGVRAKYIGARCRCLLCRAANSRYETERLAARKRGEWNGLVSAEAARKHILALSRHGVGRRAIAAASDVGQSSIHAIKIGTKTQIRARTATRILAVDTSCRSDHAHVSATRTQRLLERLKREGYPAVRLVRFLGLKGSGLQFGRSRMTVRNVQRVERLYRELMAVSA